LEDLEDGSVDTETESISGSSASGTTDLVDQHESGVHDYNVTITVIDGEGNSVSETKTVTGGDGV
ncbi:MAG: serine protease, partial [Archaeoglobaceae archaeon]